MRNYGFDYLAEKVQVLNEMARPNYWSFNFPEFNNEIYLPTAKNISEIGKVTSSGHVREKTIEYLIITMLNIFKINMDFATYVKKVAKTGPGKNYTQGFNNWMDNGGWKWSPQKEKEYALATLVEKYNEKILSPKIKNYLLDPDNIIEYLDSPSTESPAENKEINTPEDIEYILTKEKEQHNSNEQELQQRRLKLFLSGRQNITPEDEKYIKTHKFMDNNGNTVDIHDIREMIGTNNSSEQPKLKSGGRRIPKTSHAAQIYNKKLSDKLGIDRYERDTIYANAAPLLSQIRKLQRQESKGQLKPESPEAYFGEIINQQIGYFTLLKLGQTRGASNLDIRIAKSQQLTDEILSELSDFVEDDPEMTKEKFLDKISSYNSKDISAFGNYLIKKAQKEISDNTPDESMRYDGYSENVLHKVLDDDEKRNIFDQWYRLSRKMKTPESNLQSENVGVMSYFEEQIIKDSLSHNRGEFKDRGFKKPKNYAHWLWLNGQ